MKNVIRTYKSPQVQPAARGGRGIQAGGSVSVRSVRPPKLPARPRREAKALWGLQFSQAANLNSVVHLRQVTVFACVQKAKLPYAAMGKGGRRRTPPQQLPLARLLPHAPQRRDEREQLRLARAARRARHHAGRHQREALGLQ